jgi:ribonuclease VapC
VIVDSSALVAILLKEPGFEVPLEKLLAARVAGIGAPTLAEAGIVLTARGGPTVQRLLLHFVREAGLAVVPFGEAHSRAAVEAFVRFGKGRHAAALNFGDCMTYATARIAGQPLLCLGRDFTRTDLEIA